MKRRISTLLFAVVLLSTSCTGSIVEENGGQDDARGSLKLTAAISAPATKVTGATVASESGISSVNYYLYDTASGMPQLVAGERVVPGDGIFFSDLSMGSYRVVAVANAPASLSTALSYSQLMTTGSSLADNGASALVMVGEKNFTMSHLSQSENVPVERIAAKIVVGKITNCLGSGSPITLQSLYLINVAGDTDYATSAAPSVWYDRMGWRDELPALLCDTPEAKITNGAAYSMWHTFYCYPNATSSDAHGGDWSARHTRLVLKCTIDDANHSDPCYYSVTLPKIESNREYVISEIILSNEGNDADLEDYGTELADVLFNTSLAVWGTGNISLNFTEPPVTPGTPPDNPDNPDEPEDEWTGEYTYGSVSVTLQYSPDPMAADGSQASYPRVTYSQERCKVYTLSGEVHDKFLRDGGSLSFERLSGDAGLSVDGSDGVVTASENTSLTDERTITVRVTVTMNGESGEATCTVTQVKADESSPVILSTDFGVRFNESSEEQWRYYEEEEESGWWVLINGETEGSASISSGAGTTPVVVTAGHTSSLLGYRVRQRREVYSTRDVIHWSDGSITYDNEAGPFYGEWEDFGSAERNSDADSSTSVSDTPEVTSDASWLSADGSFQKNDSYGTLLSVSASVSKNDVWFGEVTAVMVLAEYGSGSSREGAITAVNGTASASLSVVQSAPDGGVVDVTDSVTFPELSNCNKSGGSYTHNWSGLQSDETRNASISYGGVTANFSFTMRARYVSRIEIDAITDGREAIKPGFTVIYNDGSAGEHHVNGACDHWSVDDTEIEAGMEAEVKDFSSGLHTLTVYVLGGRTGSEWIFDSESVEIRNNKWYNL